MSMKVPKNQTNSFITSKNSEVRNSSQSKLYTPNKNQSPSSSRGFQRGDRISTNNGQGVYGTRFQRKDLRQFEPQLYVTGNLNLQDVIDLKQVFDSYESTGVGVLLPNDITLLLSQNGFNPNRKTTYETVAELDLEETGGISFIEFMKAMDIKPYRSEDKKLIASIFKKYDRDNKNYITIKDLREVNRYLKENLDEQTLTMMLQKADSNRDGRISFQDFYSVMIKNIY